MENRDRASGWQYAKLSGHENEAILKDLLMNDPETQFDFLKKVGKAGNKVVYVAVGGLCEKDVPCIFEGEKTKSKTDMKVLLNDGSLYNVSIKKSLAGQVYLIGANRFIAGLERQYGIYISEPVKRAIFLFWGYSDDILSIVDAYGTQKPYETRKHRLVGDTLKLYDKNLYQLLIKWFSKNIAIITDFCFSRGLAKNPNDWANVVWYKNALGENNVDDIFFLPNLYKKIKKIDESAIEYGDKGGGTTIQLPFGFVQWHSPKKTIPGDMQFHHNYLKIANL